ncbi:MAG: hypothetical protein ACUZ8E_17660 [Candidatus Anammoxibacter sp.]
MMSEVHSSESSKNNTIQHVDDIDVVKMRECIRDLAVALEGLKTAYMLGIDLDGEDFDIQSKMLDTRRVGAWLKAKLALTKYATLIEEIG